MVTSVTPTPFPVDYGGAIPTVVDLNGDGRPDVLFTLFEGGFIEGEVGTLIDNGSGGYVEALTESGINPGATLLDAHVEFDGDGGVYLVGTNDLTKPDTVVLKDDETGNFEVSNEPLSSLTTKQPAPAPNPEAPLDTFIISGAPGGVTELLTVSPPTSSTEYKPAIFSFQNPVGLDAGPVSIVVNAAQSGAQFTAVIQTPEEVTGGSPVYDILSGSLNIVGSSVPCYCRGTRILTARGEIAVEDLHVGDLAVTRLGRGAALKPIGWLGHRRITLIDHAQSDDVKPIRIRTGAMSEGQPRRDLLVSPGHRMHLDGALIRAIDLVNGATIAQECPPTVEYWHVELEGHDILVADGVEAESYQDTGNRSDFENSAVVALRPVLDGKIEEPCVPYGQPSRTLRERLIQRAEAIGWSRTRDPQPWLEVGAARVEPTRRGHRYRFVLPAGCKEARLRSTFSTPAYLDAASSDSRRLGMPLIGLTLSGPGGAWNVPLDSPLLCDGFSHEEHEAGWSWRWTDGSACIPLEAMTHGQEVTCLEIALDHSELLYWNAPPQSAVWQTNSIIAAG